VLGGEIDIAVTSKPPFAIPKSCEWRTVREEPFVVLTPSSSDRARCRDGAGQEERCTALRPSARKTIKGAFFISGRSPPSVVTSARSPWPLSRDVAVSSSSYNDCHIRRSFPNRDVAIASGYGTKQA
jgi:DNA-binding transcriptional LysR family regulator